MPIARHVILIGLRTAGKSTVGRLLAERLEVPLADLDDATAALLHAATPADAINEHGITAFRHAEATALEQALDRPPHILALGGGTPTAPTAADQLRRADAVVVYLHAEPAVLRERLASTDTATRPGLTTADPLAEVETLYLERDELFRDLADAIVEVGSHDPLDIADAIDMLISDEADD